MEETILSVLTANFYRAVSMQTANAKNTEEKYDELTHEKREEVKKGLSEMYAELSPAQKDRLEKLKPPGKSRKRKK